MRLLSEFSYPDVSQRRVILFNLFITFITLGFIYFDLTYMMKYFFVYLPVCKIIFLSALIGLLCGNILGKIIFAKAQNSRIVYIASDLLFIIISVIYIGCRLVDPSELYSLFNLSFQSPYYIIAVSFLITFLAGIKVNYFLKVSCGDFIDDKKGAMPFVIYYLIGLFTGIILGITLYYYKELYYLSEILLVLILPTIFIIKLSYNPSPIYAQELHDKEEPATEEYVKRDDMFFTYLNFTYILIYLYLGIESFIKIYGDLMYIKGAFILISLLAITLGFIIAQLIKKAFWYIYSEMLYPICFLLFLALLYNFENDVSYYISFSFFIPASLIFGFSLYHTIAHILSGYNHKNRFDIIDFSFFILPAPIFILLSLIDFTNFWYFVLFYFIALLNILIPGFFLLRNSISGYKKIFYSLFSLMVIPLMIFTHLSFDISLNDSLYITHSCGLKDINRIDYESEFIKHNATVYIKGIKTFRAKENVIRNMKRSIMPISLYNSDEDDLLFIDGGQKFFKNPMMGYFKNAVCLDYLPERAVDFQKTDLSGNQDFVVENSSILTYLRKKDSLFNMIVDIPNLFDQTHNPFRFSREYYGEIKRYLKQDGIFVQIFDLSNCRSEFLVHGTKSLKNSFKEGISFLFPNLLVIMTSDNPGALKIDRDSIRRIKRLLRKKGDVRNLFYNESHLLSHLLFLEIEDIIVYLDKDRLKPFYYIDEPRKIIIDRNLMANYIDNNRVILDLIEDDTREQVFRREIKKIIRKNNRYLSILKEAEIFEANDEYEKEAEWFTRLLRMGKSHVELKRYLSRILPVKEDFYYYKALKYEKKKKWNEAQKLYKAMLIIDKNNFEANYRLGILCIILQDLDESFKYLQHAMKLKKDDPKVLYQMGVLHFSRGEPNEALNYLLRALQLREKTSSVFLYLGLCHEELGNLRDAKWYYEKAIEEDQNDINIISNLKRIEDKITERRERWKPWERKTQSEVELGEDMPLPIIESAKEIRLKEEEAISTEIR